MSESHAEHGTLTIPAVDTAPIRQIAMVAAGAGLGALVLMGFIANDAREFFFSYLSGYIYWACVPFGALGLTMIGHLATASWGVVLRRMFQASVRTLPIMGLLFLPIAVSLFLGEPKGTSSPYWWSDTSWVGDSAANVAKAKGTRFETAEENAHKIHDYLSPSFFLLRTAIYFVVLGGLAFQMNKWGQASEDKEDAGAISALASFSGPGVVLWVLLMTFAVTDWVMSVEPTWASSMFPIVFGMNMFLTTFAFSIFVFYSLSKGKGEILGIVKEKFRIDMGSLLFSFTMIWAYASFCQYMLIWSANLPEEITYYRKRGDHGWEYLAYFLMLFHWFIPFIVLLFRGIKTDPEKMRKMCLLLLVVCAADVIWWLVPAIPHTGSLHVPMAIAAIVGVGGLWGLAFARELARRPIMATNSETQFLATWGHH